MIEETLFRLIIGEVVRKINEHTSQEATRILQVMAATQADLDAKLTTLKAAIDALPAPAAAIDFTPEVTQVDAMIAEVQSKAPAPAPTPTP
jgi:hypothetical protein